MTTLTLPRAQLPLTMQGAAISPEWYRWARDITERAGGVTGMGSHELALSQFEDAGIEETKALLYVTSDSLAQQNEIAQLRELVAVLAARIEAIEQGVSL